MRLDTEKNRINDVIQNVLKNIGALVDVNTVIGKPIKTDDGEYIIPISKVTLGVLSGGGEYGKLNIFNKNSQVPYSAGNGAIVSIKPCGFLLKDIKNNYKMLSVAQSQGEKMFEKAIDFISEINKEKENE